MNAESLRSAPQSRSASRRPWPVYSITLRLRMGDALVGPSLSFQNVYYAADVPAFLAASDEAILGTLASRGGSIEASQRDAWVDQIVILKESLVEIAGTLFLEFSVPRIGSRIDAVLVSSDSVFVIEFKIGESRFLRSDINQVWDYALDLKYFHRESHNAHIVPILVASEADHSDEGLSAPYVDLVYPPVRSNRSELTRLIRSRLQVSSGLVIDAAQWAKSRYEPTPTIIEAAQALYSQHSVSAITRNEAGSNLSLTSSVIETVIDDARANRRKAIVFVTGVPGAGKTLVGLNVATRKREESPTHAVFLSGNGPLVDVLREALARDELRRLRQTGVQSRRGETRERVKTFIQNVHHFRDDGLRTSDQPPVENVVIFDEAQRAWNLRKTAQFMARKKGRANFPHSEPEFLVSYMNRREDWAVVVCLVGGGQEINDGEAGISAWLDAIQQQFSDWHVYVSPELTDSEYAAGNALAQLENRPNVVRDVSLHLSVSMRSFRSETVSRFVKCVLDCEEPAAREQFSRLSDQYPIRLTRDLSRAKEWVRANARASERFGLVVSSNAQRLKPHAIDVRVKIDPIHWFLGDEKDTRSSWYSGRRSYRVPGSRPRA